ncbi:hypothetical protein EQM14_04790 [Caproiciproducens sp. NJN-50]|uniref:hypothetical protein n=1 Tax=Caproiciproducens sp. NJN-50 TaxID=2507162 RepID=UPI000FFDFBCB|nr:hypothetical protein [Caproiciproducens sp. NJN-50]QAT49145.1 hypothetical protein EQM14_04790 [Caproiciproducens sp. NJN-50]
MSERTETLKRSLKRDEQKVIKLQEGIKFKKEKLRDLENTEILSSLNSLSARGFPISEIIDAIGDRDTDALTRLMAENELSEKESGTGSASQIIKEATRNE